MPGGRTLSLPNFTDDAPWDYVPRPGTIARFDAVAISPDGTTIATSEAGKILFRDAGTGSPIGQPIVRTERIVSLAFRPDGKAILSGSVAQGEQGEVRLWATATSQPLSAPLAHPGHVIAAAFRPDGRAIATGCERLGTNEKTDEVRVWDLASDLTAGIVINASNPAAQQTEVPELSGDKMLIKYGAESARLEVRPTEGPWTIGPPLVHAGGISAQALNVDGTVALLGGPDGRVLVLDPVTGKPIGPPLAHPAPISALAFYRKEGAIVVRCQDKTIHLWKLPTPVSGEVERVVLWVQVISGMELDPTSGVRLLDTPNHQRLRQRLEALGGPPP